MLRTSPGVGPSVRSVFVAEARVLLGLALLVGLLLLVRQSVATGKADGRLLDRLQRAATAVLGLQGLLLLFGIGLPALLLAIHDRDLLIRSAQAWFVTGAGTVGGSLSIVSVLAYLAKRGAKSSFVKKLVPRLMPIALALLGPLVVGIPLVAVTFFVALKGTEVFWPAWLLGGSLATIFVYWLLIDEVTSNMHWFYRERLATVFAGLRDAKQTDNGVQFSWGQPPWKDPILLSKIDLGSGAAKLPNLVVCAAVNVSDDVLPPGRLAGPFTFERGFSGSPLTGYVPTTTLERAAGPHVLTLPAMMAISGAAVSPSMGKMTRPWARFLLALFNARLGAWLPNPLYIRQFTPGETSIGAAAVRRTGPPRTEEPKKVTLPSKARRPGPLYLLREALGQNGLGRRYVYVTDGGHWDNLGLVELLRRGCGLILCFDAAGDDLQHFHTLSEAIELARSDLGVEIVMKLKPLKPDPDDPEGFSAQPYAEGIITYPDGTTGRLLFAKAAITRDTPQDALDWREHDPRFPTNPTTDQWFDDRQFESYRALGKHAARSVVRALESPRTDSGEKQTLVDLATASGAGDRPVDQPSGTR